VNARVEEGHAEHSGPTRDPSHARQAAGAWTLEGVKWRDLKDV